MTRFVDSHAHLDGTDFADLQPFLDRAAAAGLTDIVCIGASDGFDSNPRTIALVEQHPHLFATVGIHPHDAKVFNAQVSDSIRALADHDKVVAIGEIGLDYHYDASPRPKQRETFDHFLNMAKDLGLPAVIHTRDAEDDTIAMLRNARAEQIGGVIHCFTGTEGLAQASLDVGFYISFSGVLTFRNADRLRGIAQGLPRDRVLVETDCPFLAPVPMRGQKNEPSFILHTAQVLADQWGCSMEEVKAATGENAARLFRLPART